MTKNIRNLLLAGGFLLGGCAAIALLYGPGERNKSNEAVAQDAAPASNMKGDCPMWGITTLRNNAPEGTNIATEWGTYDAEKGIWKINREDFDRASGEWTGKDAKNIKWVSRLGSQSYGNCVVVVSFTALHWLQVNTLYISRRAQD